ncbi:MAG TPA: hypothetical protein VK961_04185 [Chthoniobacter sp.]|nr:hypothetical protein [Chthoniobacter sp.]
MHTRFHVVATIADITDFEFLLHGYLIEGPLEPGMYVRLRPQARLHTDLRIHGVELDETFARLEGKPYYTLTVQCSDLAETEALHALRIRREDIEIHSLPD